MKAIGYRNGRPVTLDLYAIGGGFYLEYHAAKAFVAMREAALADGIALKVNTAFRTIVEQTELYNRWLSWPKLSAEDKLHRKKPGRAAPPGKSTHQSGISVDLNRAPGDDPATPEPDSPVDRWLQQHAWRFGFVNDVPDEAWHYSHLPDRARLIGVERSGG